MSLGSCQGSVFDISFRILQKVYSNLQVSRAESFYYNYGLSFFTSNNLSNENIKTSVTVSRENNSFWHFNSRFVLKTTETPVFMFSLLRLFDALLMD